ncbi:MAG: hypothetical protein R3B46_11675 [Phycisphaerales bacterium]
MNRVRMMTIGALTAPALVALIAPRMGIGSVPGSAMARDGGVADPGVTFQVFSITPTKEQEAALARIAAIGEGAGLASPFLEPTENNIVPDDVPADVPQWDERLAETVKLSTVFGGSRGAGAMINGKMFGEGDDIGEGVVIESIDVAGRSVVVSVPGGERYRLNMAARNSDPTVVTRLED